MKRNAMAGQALVEAVAAIPIVIACGMLAAQALVAGAAYVYADNATHAGALAIVLGEDPDSAARRALPGWARGRVRVRARGGRVDVVVRPRAIVPGLTGLLQARGSAVVPDRLAERRAVVTRIR